MVEKLNNTILLTVDNNHIKNTRDADDLNGLLSKDPYDLNLISALIPGKIIHIVSDNFNEVAYPTHIYVILPEKSPFITKLNFIKGDDKLAGAFQIWLQSEAFKSLGLNPATTREFVTTLAYYNEIQGAINICIDKSQEGLDHLINVVLDPSWQ